MTVVGAAVRQYHLTAAICSGAEQHPNQRLGNEFGASRKTIPRGELPGCGGERLLIISQRVQRFRSTDVSVGFLVVALQSGNRWFSPNPGVRRVKRGNVELRQMTEKKRHVEASLRSNLEDLFIIVEDQAKCERAAPA